MVKVSLTILLPYKLQPDGSNNDQGDKREPQNISWFAQEEYSEENGAGSTDSCENDIGGPYRDGFKGSWEKEETGDCRS